MVNMIHDLEKTEKDKVVTGHSFYTSCCPVVQKNAFDDGSYAQMHSFILHPDPL